MASIRNLALCIALAMTPAFAGQPSQTEPHFHGIGRAEDGDSLMVGNREVRLFGIDAPELDQSCTRSGQRLSCGSEAKAHLAQLVAGL